MSRKRSLKDGRKRLSISLSEPNKIHHQFMSESISSISKIFFPDVLQWLINCHHENTSSDPLCIAATLQFAFNILTLTKSIFTPKILGLNMEESGHQ